MNLLKISTFCNSLRGLFTFYKWKFHSRINPEPKKQKQSSARLLFIHPRSGFIEFTRFLQAQICHKARRVFCILSPTDGGRSINTLITETGVRSKKRVVRRRELERYYHFDGLLRLLFWLEANKLVERLTRGGGSRWEKNQDVKLQRCSDASWSCAKLVPPGVFDKIWRERTD